MKEAGGGFSVLSHLIRRCTIVVSDVVLQLPSENFFQQAYLSSLLMVFDLHSKYRYRCRATGVSPVRTGLLRMSQMSSLQNPRSSASSRCCLARFHIVGLTSHAPFDTGRRWLPGLRSRDGHRYFADSGRCRSAFRADADHSFRAMSISDSGGCRSLIPE